MTDVKGDDDMHMLEESEERGWAGQTGSVETEHTCVLYSLIQLFPRSSTGRSGAGAAVHRSSGLSFRTKKAGER